jgi:hypothetical protein
VRERERERERGEIGFVVSIVGTLSVANERQRESERVEREEERNEIACLQFPFLEPLSVASGRERES